MRAVADFATLMEEHGAFELVGGFAFVQTCLATPSERWVRVPIGSVSLSNPRASS
jgi:hypothetical protein